MIKFRVIKTFVFLKIIEVGIAGIVSWWLIKYHYEFTKNTLVPILICSCLLYYIIRDNWRTAKEISN